MTSLLTRVRKHWLTTVCREYGQRLLYSDRLPCRDAIKIFFIIEKHSAANRISNTGVCENAGHDLKCGEHSSRKRTQHGKKRKKSRLFGF